METSFFSTIPIFNTVGAVAALDGVSPIAPLSKSLTPPAGEEVSSTRSKTGCDINFETPDDAIGCGKDRGRVSWILVVDDGTKLPGPKSDQRGLFCGVTKLPGMGRETGGRWSSIDSKGLVEGIVSKSCIRLSRPSGVPGISRRVLGVVARGA